MKSIEENLSIVKTAVNIQKQKIAETERNDKIKSRLSDPNNPFVRMNVPLACLLAWVADAVKARNEAVLASLFYNNDKEINQVLQCVEDELDSPDGIPLQIEDLSQLWPVKTKVKAKQFPLLDKLYKPS